MKNNQKFSDEVRTMIDDLKSVCANYGLGNDGNEFKIITQVFLYKFLHDKFVDEIRNIDNKFQSNDWERKFSSMSTDEYEILTMKLNENTAIFKHDQLISSLFTRQNEENYANIFDRNGFFYNDFNSETYLNILSEL